MDPALVGAFLSGIAAVISSLVSLRIVHKRDKTACDERVAEVMQTMREGLELGRRG